MEVEIEKKSEKKSERAQKTLTINYKYKEPKKIDHDRTNRKISFCAQTLEIESC